MRLLAAAADGSEEFLGAIDTTPVLLVELGNDEELASEPLATVPSVVVVIARGRPTRPAPLVADVALTTGDLNSVPAGWVAVADLDSAVAGLVTEIERSPQAAVILAQVLRAGQQLDLAAGLMVESLAYSTLQCGSVFATWLRSRQEVTPKVRPEPDDAVLVERTGDELTITLSRPSVRNAVDRRMRDELCAGLTIAAADSSVRSVSLRASGPDFSSGGDLDEFGTLPDPATAHLVRIARSPARMLATLGERVTAHVHGACVGAGVELASFAHTVVARPDARFQLPEISLGLIPGAGGTVSIRRRIGRHRTAWMGLSATFVDVPTALEWGLVDVTTDRQTDVKP
jgi:enoyl-CoA hydratase/carnithine racemase